MKNPCRSAAMGGSQCGCANIEMRGGGRPSGKGRLTRMQSLVPTASASHVTVRSGVSNTRAEYPIFARSERQFRARPALMESYWRSRSRFGARLPPTGICPSAHRFRAVVRVGLDDRQENWSVVR